MNQWKSKLKRSSLKKDMQRWFGRQPNEQPRSCQYPGPCSQSTLKIEHVHPAIPAYHRYPFRSGKVFSFFSNVGRIFSFYPTRLAQVVRTRMSNCDRCVTGHTSGRINRNGIPVLPDKHKQKYIYSLHVATNIFTTD